MARASSGASEPTRGRAAGPHPSHSAADASQGVAHATSALELGGVDRPRHNSENANRRHVHHLVLPIQVLIGHEDRHLRRVAPRAGLQREPHLAVSIERGLRIRHLRAGLNVRHVVNQHRRPVAENLDNLGPVACRRLDLNEARVHGSLERQLQQQLVVVVGLEQARALQRAPQLEARPLVHARRAIKVHVPGELLQPVGGPSSCHASVLPGA
mmetsp:Transcript_7652/g.30302  ORF Transcript_7652/g.30302 Transcript_7652/m.30302 type:complete len:213 (-) Transcript_7652:17-655(-)